MRLYKQLSVLYIQYTFHANECIFSCNEQQKVYYCEFTQLMMLKLVSSLAPGNNKLPREAKTHPLFALLSTFYLQYLPKDPCRPQQCTFLDQFNRNAHINDRLSFNLSGTDPNAPTTTGITFDLMPYILRTSLARS